MKPDRDDVRGDYAELIYSLSKRLDRDRKLMTPEYGDDGLRFRTLSPYRLGGTG